MKKSVDTKTNDTDVKIIAIAERLFAEVGFQKTTVGDIARELGMSPASVYRFYASKSDISESVVAKLLSEVEASVAEAANGSLSAAEKLRTVMAVLEGANAGRFLSHRKLHELVETAFNENWPIVHDYIEQFTKLLSGIISQGDRDGEFKVADCVLAAILFRSACVRFWHPRVMVESAQEPEPTVDLMVDFCLAAFTQGVLAQQRRADKPTTEKSTRRFPLLN
jgi:AcrR family transcriptional regulator